MTGKRPEVWDALTGERYRVDEFTDDGVCTTFALPMEECRAWCVVFAASAGERAADKAMDRIAKKPLQTIDGSWKVTFRSPTAQPFVRTFRRLEDWSKSADAEIAYFSGIAVYETAFDYAQPTARTWISLGEVHDIARVILNGHDLGVQWTQPWRVEATGYLKAKGNILRIEVANEWVNRLIGDAELPDDGTTDGKWPEWILTNKPRSSGRTSFTACRFYQNLKQQPLIPSGLVGPVKLYGEYVSH